MLLAVFAPIFGDPYATPVDGLTPTGLPLGVLHSGHILGTDSLGRDMMARVAYGARATLEIAFSVFASGPISACASPPARLMNTR